MRILAFTNLYPSPWLPDRAPFNRQQFRALAALNSLRIIAPIAWTDELRARLRKNLGVAVNRQASCDGIFVSYPRYKFPPKMLVNLYGPCMRYSVRSSFNRALTEFRPEIVYATWAYPDGWAAVKLGHKAGLPVVVKVHGSDIYLLDRYTARRQRTYEALSEAEQVVAVSQDLAQRVVDLGVSSDRVRIIRNGVDAAKFFPGSKSEARLRLDLSGKPLIILFVGNLVPLKGVELLVSACARIADEVNFSCYLIGQGPMKSRLETRIRELRLEQRIRCLGSKPHDELPDWYRAADLAVVPSFSEGMPNVLLEALACGTRFVASKVGGVHELAQGGRGKLVPAKDVEALATAMHEQLALSGNMASSENSPRSFDDSAVELTRLFTDTLQAWKKKVGVASCPS